MNRNERMIHVQGGGPENEGHDNAIKQNVYCGGCNCSCKASYRKARWISYVSIFFTLTLFVIQAVVSIDGDSSATLSAGFDSLLDVISSIFVIWRFYSGDNSRAKLEWKEKVSDFSLSWLFLLSAAVVLAMASKNILNKEGIKNEDLLLYTNVPSFVILLVLAIIKLNIAKGLNSQTMIKDAIGSFSGAGVSLGVCIGIIIFQAKPDIWWVDAFIAILIALFLIAVALRTLIIIGPWWRRSFWRIQQQEEDEQGISHNSEVQMA